MNWLCLILPWHKWRRVKQLSKYSRLDECTRCKRLWATNLDAHVCLPYEMVEHLYGGQK